MAPPMADNVLKLRDIDYKDFEKPSWSFVTLPYSRLLVAMVLSGLVFEILTT